MMLQCHSAAMAHDYRLRGGSGGSFSYPATLKNYQLSLAQLALDSPTVDPSRIVRKNLFRPELVAEPLSTPLEDMDAGDDSGAEAGEAGPGPSVDAGDAGAGDAGKTDAKPEAGPGGGCW